MVARESVEKEVINGHNVEVKSNRDDGTRSRSRERATRRQYRLPVEVKVHRTTIARARSCGRDSRLKPCRVG